MKPGKVLLFGVLGLIVAQLIAWWQQSASPFLAAVLTIAAGSIPLVLAYLKDSRAAKDKSTPESGVQPPTATTQPRGEPTVRPTLPLRGLVVGLVVLVLLGGGIAYGASYVVGQITGNEPTVQRLAKPVSGNAGALTVRIDEVGVGDHYTQLRLTATNRANFPVSIPLFNNCQLIERGGDAFEPKLGFGTSGIDVPPGSIPIPKRIIFSGTPSGAATSLTLACNTLYWQGFGQPQSLQVKRIALTESP